MTYEPIFSSFTLIAKHFLKPSGYLSFPSSGYDVFHFRNLVVSGSESDCLQILFKPPPPIGMMRFTSGF
ncbi:hypothetical protein PGT21_029773 [Puccinia graminis f. sp. tritici]|uniref:Uncharacterized protein n=1 Tax=Puccinia graminis f. sp. tritici TaxID=56615 RepID=A0A5B0MRX1_PUCGR|nr:hypothetical protein PGTUg99_023060 [Puccinia graminis f. sp. tritici]KAA1094779.1 hypothetical protein PGT21_029773 [Puccinia graminis f. sp. tritici]